MFGTDGIRGPANVHPMLPEVAMRVGMAVGRHFGRGGSVVIGKDTRRSGYMFETALASGLTAVGARVMLVGPMPTPGIAYITRSMRAANWLSCESFRPFATVSPTLWKIVATPSETAARMPMTTSISTTVNALRLRGVRGWLFMNHPPASRSAQPPAHAV